MTIDTNELRRLAQEATSGEWYVVRGNHIYGRKKVTDGEEEWHPLIACTDDDEVNVSFEVNAAFIAAANPAAISELLDRLEAAEKERDVLKAKIERMERQEPVAWTTKLALRHGANALGFDACAGNLWGEKGVPLYALPGAQAQPAPSVPEGWKLVPIVSTEEMDNAGSEHCDGYLSTAQAVWDAMLSEAPEVKP